VKRWHYQSAKSKLEIENMMSELVTPNYIEEMSLQLILQNTRLLIANNIF
jgi:hypothetical protein